MELKSAKADSNNKDIMEMGMMSGLKMILDINNVNNTVNITAARYTGPFNQNPAISKINIINVMIEVRIICDSMKFRNLLRIDFIIII